MKYRIGIDCGSTLCKGALLVGHKLLKTAYLPTGWNLSETASRLKTELMISCVCKKGDSEPVVIATGYGRDMVEGCTSSITEISAHACGAEFLFHGVRTVIDIGGQDCKIIALEGGRVTSFQMNDKCAAGSGRFVQMVMERFKCGIDLLDEMLNSEKKIALNSTCAVFAESEIIGLLAKGHSREEIMGGVIDSLALKIASLSARVAVNESIVLSGGLCDSALVRKALSKTLGAEVQHLPNGLYAGAIGAAVMGQQNE